MPLVKGVIRGSDVASGNLNLISTANATKGKIMLGSTSAFDEANTRLGIGTASPTVALDVVGALSTTGNQTCGGSQSVTGNMTVTGDLSVTGVGQVRWFQKSGSQTNATTTMAAVTGMSFSVVSNSRYIIQALLSYDAPTATDAKFNWTIPSGAAMQRCLLGLQTGTTSNENSAMQSIRRAEGTAQVAGGPNSVNNAFSVWREDIMLTVGATSGTVQLQFAANAAGTATFNDASWLIVTRIA